MIISTSTRYRIADLPPASIPVPADVIHERRLRSHLAGDVQSLRLLEAAESGLQFTEALPQAIIKPLWEALHNERRIPGERLLLSDFCIDCIRGRCSTDETWHAAIVRVADRSLPDSKRLRAASDLECHRRCTDDVVQELLKCLDDGESDYLRESVLSSAAILGGKAAAIVPRAIQIVQTLGTDPNPRIVTFNGKSSYSIETMRNNALRVIARCATPEMRDAFDFLSDRFDAGKYGIPTACHTINTIRYSTVFHDEFSDRLVELIVDKCIPIVVRETAIATAAHLLHRGSHHLPSLSRLLADNSTPIELRTALCSCLYPFAESENCVAPTFAAVVDDPSAPDDLRLRALCAFRGMPIDVQRVILEPTLRFAQHQFPLAVADIAQDLISDIIRLAVSATVHGDQDAFLATALAAPYELQLRLRLRANGIPTSHSSLLGRDVVSEMLGHPHLKQRLWALSGRRSRSLANRSRDEIVDQLVSFALDILTHPKRPLLPDPSSPDGFADTLIARIDNYAKYHLPELFGHRSSERRGQMLVVQSDLLLNHQASGELPEVLVSEQELRLALWDSMESDVSELGRQVLALHRIEGFTLDATGEVLGISREAVYRAVHRALQTLRQSLRRFAK